MCRPKKVLFMDEISTGLDSSTTFQITQVPELLAIRCNCECVHDIVQ